MTTNKTLMTRIENGEPNALRACIQAHHRLVRSLARRFFVADSEIDDVVQDVFVDVWRSACRYDGRVTEASFVAMIARRRLIDRVRRSKRRPATETLDAPALCTGARERIEARGEVSFAAKHLRALRSEQREVLMLSAMGGFSHSEISSELGMPLGTVKAHARRGMDQLRRSLGSLRVGDQMASM